MEASRHELETGFQARMVSGYPVTKAAENSEPSLPTLATGPGRRGPHPVVFKNQKATPLQSHGDDLLRLGAQINANSQ